MMVISTSLDAAPRQDSSSPLPTKFHSRLWVDPVPLEDAQELAGFGADA